MRPPLIHVPNLCSGPSTDSANTCIRTTGVTSCRCARMALKRLWFSSRPSWRSTRRSFPFRGRKMPMIVAKTRHRSGRQIHGIRTLLLADDTIPELKSAFPAVGEKKWNDAAESFRACASRENNWAALKDLPTDVEAIRALRANSVPTDSWPEALRTVAGQNRYAFLVVQEHRLAQDAARLVSATAQWDDKERLSVLVSALTFAISCDGVQTGFAGTPGSALDQRRECARGDAGRSVNARASCRGDRVA